MSDPKAKAPPALPIGEALRLLRTRLGLRQGVAARKVEGWNDWRALSAWELGKKMPSLPTLYRYLRALDLDLADLQHALDQADGRSSSLAQQFADLDRRITVLEQLHAGGAS